VSAAPPAACVACGAALASWLDGESQDPSVRRTYPLYRCPDCGTASTAAPADPELYETGVYRAGTTRLAPLISAARRIAERQKLSLLRRPLPPPARMVEVGSGQGRFIVAARAAGYRIRGLEPSRRSVEVAAEHGIELEHAGLEDAPVEAGGVDGVALWHVLEHLDDPRAALERIGGWLRPGGVLLVGVPNLASLQARIGGARWLHLDPPRHRHHFTPAGLRTLLTSSGFVVEREHHVLLEYGPFGMWEAWLDRATATPAYAYNLIKRNAPLRARDLLPTLALVALTPLAALVEIAAGLARRGGAIAVVARRV
jgi:SAM-dependent methyltransferase